MINENSPKLSDEFLLSDEQKQIYSSAISRAWNHFLKIDDMTLIVLKGHLLIEEQLKLLVDDKMIKPEKIQRISFSQYLSLANAMYELPEDMVWLWGAIRALNQLRNTMAHELTPGDIDKKINLFRSTIPQNEEHTPEYSIKDCIVETWIACMYFTIKNNCSVSPQHPSSR
ncbi:hypothetical protein [Nitrincola iocasae]|uniref:Uncharacterized protein n=1 Tax=Nitrincola iocasae TaxID=2614693 RepID=A0A5J6LES9_9GAMM|nr:hypothetical protein [Nitrincola iocasae]QEW06883.1 hypothetical protein F5I99_10395 [Nitrincola iocasae]